MFLMSRFYRPLQSPLCIFPQNLCRITTDKLLAHLSATYRLLQSRYRLIDADKVFTAIWLQSFKRLRGKPSRALRRLLTAFRYEVKGVSPMEKYGRQFADGKGRKKKTSAKQDYQDSDLGCSSQSAVPYRLAIALNSGRETICSRIIFVKHPILLNCHACARYSVKLCVVERIISFFISHTQAAYTLDALISRTHIQCQHNTGYSAITMAL